MCILRQQRSCRFFGLSAGKGEENHQGRKYEAVCNTCSSMSYTYTYFINVHSTTNRLWSLLGPKCWCSPSSLASSPSGYTSHRYGATFDQLGESIIMINLSEPKKRILTSSHNRVSTAIASRPRLGQDEEGGPDIVPKSDCDFVAMRAGLLMNRVYVYTKTLLLSRLFQKTGCMTKVCFIIRRNG